MQKTTFRGRQAPLDRFCLVPQKSDRRHKLGVEREAITRHLLAGVSRIVKFVDAPTHLFQRAEKHLPWLHTKSVDLCVARGRELGELQ